MCFVFCDKRYLYKKLKTILFALSSQGFQGPRVCWTVAYFWLLQYICWHLSNKVLKCQKTLSKCMLLISSGIPWTTWTTRPSSKWKPNWKKRSFMSILNHLLCCLNVFFSSQGRPGVPLSFVSKFRMVNLKKKIQCAFKACSPIGPTGSVGEKNVPCLCRKKMDFCSWTHTPHSGQRWMD